MSSKVLLPFFHPFTMIVSGPTSSGKTYFVRQLLENYNQMTTFNGGSGGGRGCDKPEPINVLWSYGQEQNLFKVPMKDVRVQYLEGMIEVEDLKRNGGVPNVVVLDDLMIEAVNNKEITNLFTRISHHLNISVIFIIQNLFVQGREVRNISMNAHYHILFKNKRDREQTSRFGRQLLGKGFGAFFEWAFSKATSRLFGYLVIDNHPRSKEEYQLRSYIFPWENVKGSPVIYIPKKNRNRHV